MDEFVESTMMPQFRDLIDDILDLDQISVVGLTDEETGFLDSLPESVCFTKEQGERINKIYKRLISPLEE